MTLVLEIEYLLGTCFAAIGPSSDQPDWPPQPDRIFSALVATWGAHGEKDEEAEALLWLEAQPVPRIEASDHGPRTAPTSFVPPNDSGTGRSGDKTVVPEFRRRQARRFPATRPDSPAVRLFWTNAVPDDRTLNALMSLAMDTSYVGHSASLTRCRFWCAEEVSTAKTTQPATRQVYSGRLAELRRSYEVFLNSAGKTGRPLPGSRATQELTIDETLPHAFEKRWLLLEHVSGTMPDFRASAIVSKAIRDALLSGYKRIGLEEDIPEVVSGHAADGSPSRESHLAIVPLPFVGFSYADGHVMGFALVPPRDSAILADPDFRRALRTIAPVNEDLGRRVLSVGPKAHSAKKCDGFSVDLSPTFEPPVDKRSLDPALYTKAGRTFASVAPIVLDRHLKEKGAAQVQEIIEQIIAACLNIGLPEPERIVPHKHSSFEGGPSAYPSGKSPTWMQWRLPAALHSRQLTHAVIRFPVPVQGPVILGAGRFVGLGLCRPILLDRENET